MPVGLSSDQLLNESGRYWPTGVLVLIALNWTRVVLTRSGHADDVRKTLEDSDGSLSHRPTSTARSPHLRRFPARRA